MQNQYSTNPNTESSVVVSPYIHHHTNNSAVSWAAIFAGAASTAALSFILILLGAGLGLSSISPWTHRGISAEAIGISTIVWLTVTQIIACSVGGYVAGRLRVKWDNIHNDEVYFRDTAHGMLVWAVATIVTAIFLGKAIGGVISGTAKVGESIVSGVAQTALATTAIVSGKSNNSESFMSYSINSLFRSEQISPDRTSESTQAEIANILIHDIKDGKLSAENKRYVAQIVAKKAGISQADAEKRVEQLYSDSVVAIEDAKITAKNAADTARKASASTILWMFIALLCGAFSASLMATCGGKQRDNIKPL